MSEKNPFAPEAIYERYKTNMFFRAMEYTGNREDAEDVVSEAWISLLSHFHKLPDMDDKARSAYIMRCVQNTAVSHLRKKRKTRETEALQSEIQPPQSACPESSLERMLSRLMHPLSPRERQVVELRIRGYDDEAIAKRLGIARSTVRVYLHRAHRQMRAAIKSGERSG